MKRVELSRTQAADPERLAAAIAKSERLGVDFVITDSPIGSVTFEELVQNPTRAVEAGNRTVRMPRR